MLKVELHTHTADDPVDYIAHTAQELIFRARTLRYDAIAITLHNKQLDVGPLMDYAKQQGVLLLLLFQTVEFLAEFALHLYILRGCSSNDYSLNNLQKGHDPPQP